MSESKLVDHLFRHQYGKMVSTLTRAFGLSNLEIIEDAVQDTFIKALQVWKNKMPDNPEAWLIAASKNRVIDIFRKVKTDQKREGLTSGPSAIAINEIFLDSEIHDSQLRMIFTACHPALKPDEQISFALKTISGFSEREIAAALLTKVETIKKRLQRARKRITQEDIKFGIPLANDLPNRLESVLSTLYLIFNEGFHSTHKDQLVRKELCAEAIRLTNILLKSEQIEHPDVYALFALMSFHAARLDSKIGSSGELISLNNQDRKIWDSNLIQLGNMNMYKAVETDQFSTYHYEAAIAAEHLKAKSFEETNWSKIAMWYDRLYQVNPSPFLLLNMAIVQLQMGTLVKCQNTLDSLDPRKLNQRAYLFHSTQAEIYCKEKKIELARASYLKSLELVINESEKKFLLKRLNSL